MEHNAIRFVLGAAVNLEIWVMLTCNIICLLCIYKGKLYNQKDNPVFVITGLNMLVETLQLLLHLVYVGPAIWIGDWIFEGQDSTGVTIAATYFLGLWYLGSFNQITMAFNRLCVVCFPTLQLTRNKFLIAFAILAVFSAGLVTYSQLLSPCCRITPDPRYFGYSYLVFANQTENPSMTYVDVPLDSITSIICVLSYLTLFSYIVKMGRTSGQNVKNREIRLCVQFVIVFFTYTVTWSSFFIFPRFGIPYAEAYITTTVMFMANCGINAVILLLLNKEIQREFYKMFKMSNRLSDITFSTLTTSNNAPKSIAEPNKE